MSVSDASSTSSSSESEEDDEESEQSAEESNADDDDDDDELGEDTEQYTPKMHMPKGTQIVRVRFCIIC